MRDSQEQQLGAAARGRGWGHAPRPDRDRPHAAHDVWPSAGALGGPVAPFTELLLDHGADPNVRASVRKQLHPGYGEDTLHEYRDVTPLSWGRRFHHKIFVSEPALRLIAERGGGD